jgi:hypothetical protein
MYTNSNDIITPRRTDMPIKVKVIEGNPLEKALNKKISQEDYRKCWKSFYNMKPTCAHINCKNRAKKVTTWVCVEIINSPYSDQEIDTPTPVLETINDYVAYMKILYFMPLCGSSTEVKFSINENKLVPLKNLFDFIKD